MKTLSSLRSLRAHLPTVTTPAIYAVAAFVASSISTASAADCVKLTVSSDGQRCQDLKVSADLAACDDVIVGTPELRCTTKSAEVTIHGAKLTYIAKLKNSTGAWGQNWEIAQVRTRPAKPGTPALASATASEAVLASPAPLPVAAPSAPAPDSKPNGFQFAAYFDAYYAYNFNQPHAVTNVSSTTPQSAMVPSGQNNLHFYDWYSNQLGLNLAEFTIKHQRNETAFLLDLDFGQMADINAQAPVSTASGGPSSATVDEVSKHIGQVIFTYTPKAVSSLVIEMGKMPTHVGLELIKARDNWNYSRGVLFSFGGPFWHTGLHAGYSPIANRLATHLYLYQGWNTIYENNAAPTLGAQLKWTPSDSVTVVYNYIGGPEQAGNTYNRKQVHEANLTYVAHPQLTLAADFLAGSEAGVTSASSTVATEAKWTGAAALAKWQLSPRYSLAPRYEIYRDTKGYTVGGVAQTLTTFTLTNAFQVSEGFETRLEYRLDQSTARDRFIKRGGTGVSDSQSVILASFLYTM